MANPIEKIARIITEDPHVFKEEAFNSPGMDDKLSECMANSYVLAQRAWAFHWNYEGNSFSELHKFFGEIYEDLFNEVDEFSERVRALGSKPPSSLKEILDSSSVDDDSASSTNTDEMVKNLLKGLESHQDCMRQVLKLADENNDEATIELASRRLGKAEKFCWMLRSQQN